MRFNTDISIFSVVSIGLSLGVAAYEWWSNKRLTRVCAALDKAVDNFKDEDVDLEITQELVEEAVYDKVSKEVEYRMSSVTATAMKEAKTEFKNAIDKEISEQYADIKESVRVKVAERVDDLDINDVKKQVIREAKRDAQEKFRESLNAIEDRYEDDLDTFVTQYKKRLGAQADTWDEVADTLRVRKKESK